MRRRSQTRRVLKWTGALLTALLLCTWVYASTHWTGVRYRNWLVWLEGGSLVVMRVSGSPVGPPNWVNIRCPFEMEVFYWKSGRLLGKTASAELHLPLWIPFVVVAAPTALLFWLDRCYRFPPGYCRNCGYDLTGNVSGRCPECGESVKQEAGR